MGVAYSASQVRALFARVKRSRPAREGLTPSAVAPSGAVGACIVTRPGRNTMDICQQTTAAQCLAIETELAANNAGTANFFAGRACRD